MHNSILPLIFSLLALVNMAAIWRGDMAIRAGRRGKHRNLMAFSLFLWLASLAAMLFMLWPQNIWRLVRGQILLWAFVLLSLAALALIAAWLYQLAKGRAAQHRALARNAYIIWQLSCLSELVLFFMFWFTFTM